MKNNKDRFFFPEEWMKFEDALKPKQKHSCKILLNTGARHMEASNIKVSDIFFHPDQSRITLRITKCKAKKGEKKGKQRMIPISKQFAKYLQNYIKENKLKDDDYLNVLSRFALNICMKKAAEKVGLQEPGDFSPHNLRKTLETWLVALNVDGLKLAVHFGHDVMTAAKSYVSADAFTWEEKKQMRQIIGDLYER